MKNINADVLTMFCACSFHGNPMNNVLSYCGLIDAKIRASDKDLPVSGQLRIPNRLLLKVIRNFVLHISYKRLSFCQNDPPMGKSLWQKESMATHRNNRGRV